MNVLALDAYHGGSHQALLEGWSAHSRHEFHVLTLPAHHWKWRMRHAAVTFAEHARTAASRGARWDAVFATDMLNLAEFVGLAGACVVGLPTVVYFHENQLTYPSGDADERDLHYAFSNFVSALAARRAWFNSAFHRAEFLTALSEWLGRMPDYRPTAAIAAIRDKSEVHSPGIEPFAPRGPRRAGPLRIVWAARWEHDKDPETFFSALRHLRDRACDFRVSVLGESFRHVPSCFGSAQAWLAPHVEHWGYVECRERYRAVLAEADVVVSTALHEFFGIAVVEAVAAGAFPLVPRRLAYPEVLGSSDEFYHDGSAAGLAARLAALAERVEHGNLWGTDPNRGMQHVERFAWPRIAAEMDEALLAVV